MDAQTAALALAERAWPMLSKALDHSRGIPPLDAVGLVVDVRSAWLPRLVAVAGRFGFRIEPDDDVVLHVLTRGNAAEVLEELVPGGAAVVREAPAYMRPVVIFSEVEGFVVLLRGPARERTGAA